MFLSTLKWHSNATFSFTKRFLGNTAGYPVLHIPRSSIYPLGAGKAAKPLFQDVTWTISPEDAWVVLSVGTTSGKTNLLQALTGHLRISPPPPPPDGLFPFLQGRDPHDSIALVSFAHRSRAAGGAFVDFTARYGAVREEDKVTLRDTFFPETAKPLHELAIPSLHAHPNAILPHEVDSAKETSRRQLFEELVDTLALRQFLDLPMIALSNGQTRKARIIKTLLEQPDLLILDEPLTGLDVSTRSLLLSILSSLHKSPGRPHIIMGMRIQDPLPDWTTHVAIVHKDGTIQTGKKEDILKTIADHIPSHHFEGKLITATHPSATGAVQEQEPLVDLDDVNVSYGDRKVLKNINWKIEKNSRWHLLGANGAGKTTLLALITGEHPQSYTNSSKLRLFSRPRAKWPTPHLHARIGRVSPELHNAFPRRKGLTVWDAIGTAFDGGFVPRGRKRVGLSEDGTELEEGGEIETWRLNRMWHVLEGLGPTAWSRVKDREALEAFSKRPFADLSHGEQSIVLLMRALVTQPPLVLLDEAWSGMDEEMVEAARKYLREGGGLQDGQACVVISHWEEEVPWGWNDGVRRFQLIDGVGKELFPQ
ncbi:hypothetical protein ABKN59_000572 [Abortiporus biennis]